MKGLSGKRVLITGGAMGIGKATAIRFLDEGAKVTIIDRDEIMCQNIKQELPGLEDPIIADVSDYDSVVQAFRLIEDKMNGVDVLINNAGISVRQSFLDMSREKWLDVININLNGVFYVAQQAARHMIKGEGGVILNMGSTNALMGYHMYSSYNASKAGVVELTRSLALELAPKIRVNAVCPICSKNLRKRFLLEDWENLKRWPLFLLILHQTRLAILRANVLCSMGERSPEDWQAKDLLIEFSPLIDILIS
jgi:NAD(P)-dependent dehydrogenase (short-subunit alcohol dehydrogenase family)